MLALATINTTTSTYSRRPYTPAFTTVSDQDFYCSFTHLPCTPAINLDELPFTIHSPYSRLPSVTMFGSPRSNSTSTGGTSYSARSSLRSFLSTSTGSSTSSRRRRIFSKVRQPFGLIFSSTRRKSTTTATQTAASMLMKTSRKPSTLDFRCIGAEGAAAASNLNLGWREGWEAPRINWNEPSIAKGWDQEGWFEGI